jgi:UDP-glucose-4-epimerase GalE
VQALLRARHDVIVYDNLSQGHVEPIERLALAAAADAAPPAASTAASSFPRAGADRVTFVHGDIRDLDRLRETLVQHRVDAVMHFAALLLVGESVKHPIPYYDTNVGGALIVLQAMVEAGVGRFIFSSTCATFGEPRTTPIAEDHPQQPINAYGETKLTVERALPHYERAYGLKSVVLRYFNAAGADPDGLLGEDHQPEIHLIPRAIDAVLGGEALAVFGEDYPTPDGTCLRDYVHVADLADAHLRALGRLEDGGTSAHYNLGTGRPQSVREILTAVEQVSGRPVPHSVQARRPGDPAILFAANAKVRRELGWEPRFADLREIVDTAWRWRCRHPQGYRTVSPTSTPA